MAKIIDLTGQRFGRWTVIERAPGPCKWLCQCDCGEQKALYLANFKSGRSRSCGCLNVEIHTTHGHTRFGALTGTYVSWDKMLQRCGNPNDNSYHNYGGRGITVCDRWRKFENFYADMGDRPEGMEIDRFPDNDGNYEPGNCRWATRGEQSRNTRRNRLVEFQGRTQCLMDWANETGIHCNTLRYRLRNGWGIERALTTPGKGGA